MLSIISRFSVAALALMVSPSGICAQPYPDRPIRLVVPSGPVGTNDILGRLAALKLTEALGQQVIVDNRPGATGIIGVQVVSKAPADGYTLLIGNVSTLAVNLSLHRNLPYDPVRDFQPITLIAKVPQILVVNPSVPANSVKELIALARAKPGTLTYGSGTAGTGAHLSGELLKSLAKIDIVQVPYKTGVGGALIELLGGQISMAFGGVPGVAPHIRSQKLRALGVTGATRTPVFPQLPTIAEAGVPGYEVTLWYGLLAPAGTPQPVVALLNRTLVKALNAPETREHMSGEGAEPAPMTPEQFSAFIKTEIGRWTRVMKDSGIKPQ
jgi:tripartite-type tricarboxylate transporter receptor subunit TctC